MPSDQRSPWRRPGLQRLGVTATGLAPRWAHRMLAGAGRERGGRRLEPDLEVLAGLLDRFGWPDFTRLAPAAARQEVEREGRAFAQRPLSGITVTGLNVPTPGGPAPARLYVPAGLERPGPLILYLHGGGWVLGSPASYDDLCRFLARHSGLRVLSASYRLAPEHPFPAAVEDALAALRWTLANTGSLAATHVGIGGDSAGGNLAAVLSRNEGQSVAFQFLLYPVTDLSREHPSYGTYADGPYLTADEMRWFRAHYLSRDEDAQDPRASPLLADDVAGMPPTYLAVAGFDPLCDEGLAYAARLREAGNELTLAMHDGQVHGFADLTMASTSARAATLEACRWLAGITVEG